jgi:3-deoxy-D-manno-octulosonic-acid transferase
MRLPHQASTLATWLLAYRLLMWCLSPLWRYVLTRRLKHGKETLTSQAQKLMLAPVPRPTQGAVIWGHAVGVGEALALAGLFAQLAQRLPEHHFLITSSAKTSAQALHTGQLPPRCSHQFSPIDTPQAAQAFLNHWHPSLAIWCEMDLWPCLMGYTHQMGIPMLLVNARVSQDVFNKRRWFKLLYQDILKQFDFIYCQNEASQKRLIQLGADANHTLVCGSIKALAQPLQCDVKTLIALQARIGQRPCWLLASSHEGEETIALAAHQTVLQEHPNALLLIAPRYPHRGDALVQQFGLQHAQRSKGHLPDVGTSVYLCDTIGEMGLWYRLSSVALIGGSLVPVGGHNPYEALLLGCAVMHGKYVHNFTEAYASTLENNQCQMVETVPEISNSVLHSITNGLNVTNTQYDERLDALINQVVNDARLSMC